MWRDLEAQGVEDVLRGLAARALVWGDVDPYANGLARPGRRDLCLRISVAGSHSLPPSLVHALFTLVGSSLGSKTSRSWFW